MRASSISENKTNYVEIIPKLNLLKAAVIYGANNSGKSNFISAIDWMMHLLSPWKRDDISDDPFEMEISFYIKDRGIFRYGFFMDKRTVIKEWLYGTFKSQEINLFIRNEKSIKFHPKLFKEAKGLQILAREDRLFLYVVDAFNGEISKSIMNCFCKISVTNGLTSDFIKKILKMTTDFTPIAAGIENGIIYVVDDLTARLHPLVTQSLINQFHNNKTNSQLIFTTHDTSLLSKDLFRRDQIWFTQKDKNGSSDLYSLVEFKNKDNKKVRNDADYEKHYLAGRYGGIPLINPKIHYEL